MVKAKKSRSRIANAKKAPVKNKPKSSSSSSANNSTKRQSPTEKNDPENKAREAVKIAQRSTLDIIRASAQKIKLEKPSRDPDDTDDNLMELLAPRRRGRPSKHERNTKKTSHIYEPEFNGLMDDKVYKTSDEPEVFHKENEMIDFWTDDDIPLANSWKDDVLEF